MTDHGEFRRLRTRLAVSPAVREQLEREVMTGIVRLPAKHRRRKILVAISSSVVLAAMLFVFAGRERAVQNHDDYVESVLFAEDHVFIWLEPVVTTGSIHD